MELVLATESGEHLVFIHNAQEDWYESPILKEIYWSDLDNLMCTVTEI